MTLKFSAAPLALLLLVGSIAYSEEEQEYPHGEFMEDCGLCHQGEEMVPVKVSDEFDHAKRGIPLRGAHALADCRACHKTLEFAKAERDCVACHMDPHRNEFGPDCANCHTARSFIDRDRMSRAHQATRFPLRGSHLSVECEDCHRPGSPGHLQWTKTPVECAACHLDDYQATTSPDHQEIGFPATCENCHRPTVWRGAVPDFNHDGLYFPIFSGSHRNEWDGCRTCHTNQSDYSEFTCFNCHRHGNQADTDEDHGSVSGYVYDSDACYSCHPDGRE